MRQQFAIILLVVLVSLFFLVDPVAPTSQQEGLRNDPITNGIDERRVPVYVHFSLSRHWKQSNFQWQVVSNLTEDDSSLVVSSQSTKHHTTDPTARKVVAKFTAVADQMYSLIIDGLEEENLMPNQDQKVPALANVTLSFGGLVLASANEISLHTKRHIIAFNTASTSTKNRGIRHLQKVEERPDDKTPPPRGVNKPPPPPSPPPPPPPISAPQPTPQQPNPTQPVISPVQTISPVQAPVIDGGDNTVTIAPTVFSGVKPPSFLTNSLPSLSPTIELPCVSSTNGSVAFNNKYIAVKIRLTEAQDDVGLSQNDTTTILTDIQDAYNTVAICDQKGAFRRINQAELVRINDIGSTSIDVEWIVRLVGSCEGCIDSAIRMFSSEELSVNGTSENATDSAVEGMQTASTCFCLGPTKSTFQDQFNLFHQSNSTEDEAMLTAVVELENAESCDPLALQEDSPPQTHTTLVSLILSRDPSDMTEADIDSTFQNFTDTVHSQLSLTFPTCDLSRKRIVDVKRAPDNQEIGRNLRHVVQSQTDKVPSTRTLQQTNVDFELVVEVTFDCFGCEGRLFGVTNFTPSSDCWCPTDPDRFGVGEREILSPLNEALSGLSLDQSISDIIEIEAVPCSSTVNIFPSIVVIEYILPSNTTIPTDEDLFVLANEFVAGYNGVARRYCDPFFRRLTSAETLDNYGISEDGLRASLELSVVGVCRGECEELIQIYDPESFLVNMSVASSRIVSRTTTTKQVNQLLQTQSDSTCYCSVAAPKDLGPSEAEVVQNFGDLVDGLSLESISEVADCNPLAFQTGIFLTLPDSLANVSQAELDEIGQTFLDSYNEASSEEGFCDQYFRKLVDIRVDRNVTILDSFTVSGDQVPTSSGRKLMTRTSFRSIRRNAQETQTTSPTFFPTSSPTVFSNGTFVPTPSASVSISSDTLIFLDISGSCQGCVMEMGLFDQVSARRRSEESDPDENIVETATDDRVDTCFCPPRSQLVELTEEQVTLAVSSLPFVDGEVRLEEVEIVECSVEVTDFETIIPLDFLVNGEIVSEDEEYIGSGFITTYIRLSSEYCDSLFRRPNEVVSTMHEQTVAPNQDGISTVRFWLQLQGTCRGCTGNEELFDGNRRRLQEEELCFCDKGAVSRAPSDKEFQKAFAEYLTTGRRKLQQSKFSLLCVGSMCPEIVIEPSNAPTGIVLVNPNGIEIIAGCEVPNPSYIGDGYCDRDVDANGLAIYNSVECANDGGDCCASTCQSFLFECGSGGYSCPGDEGQQDVIDVIDTTACTGQVGDILGDSICNLELNIPFCAYDNGDCCESTCGVMSGLMCSGPYACVDPSALENAPSANPSFVPSIMPTIMPSVMPTFIPTITPLPALTQFCRANLDCDPSSWCGDGWCDVSLNNEACGWDGGDCCEQTCVKDEDTDFDCDMSGFLCIDPAHAVGIELPDGCDVEIPLWIGDGICDQFGNYNTLACGYDGGDCCPDTCVGVDDGLCSYFVCIRDLPDGCDVFEPAWLGDGYCDSYPPFNADACEWDFGDCCPDTCSSTNIAVCGFTTPYICFDPDSPFQEFQPPPQLPPNCNVSIPGWLGDGYCDGGPYNVAECDWDFGDCCPATCEAVDWFQPYDCGIAGYDCLDPGAPVLPPTGTVSRTVSPQPSSAPAPTIEVYGNPNFGYSMASGTYSASSTATLFGDAVYYNEFYMLYWCGDTLQWTIQLITDIGKIALYGCQGQGLSSLENTEPVSLCDTKWENTEGLVLLVVTTEDCPLDPSPPVIPGADFDVVGNGYTYGDDISGNYVASANSVFGVGVFYNGDFILYWCEPTSQWYLGSVDSIGTIESIRLFGCSGIMQSNPVSGPEVSICDVTWDDLIIFTTGCEKPDPPAPAIPGPDVQVIGSPSSGLFEFSGTYSGSSTDSISGVSIYYSDWSVIYWCEDTSQWYLYWIVSVDTIQNFGCEGWPSNPISGDPELLCEANWEDEFGNPSLLLSSMGSDDCPSYIPVPSTTGTAASFDLVVEFFGIPSVCAGTYIELEAVTAAGGLIFSNGACIFYQRFDDRWDWATILDLGAVQSLGVVESPIDSGFLQSDYPCGAGFQSALFCSPDCNSPWTAITPSVTFDVASLGQFEQSATLINGASVWFNCFGHFELYTDSYYSFWIFVAKAGFEVIFSDFVSSTDFCEANWYGIIEITSCPAGDFDFGISSASPMPSATVMPTTTPISTTTPVPSDATTTNSPTTDETTSFSSSFPSSFPTSFSSSFPSSVPPTV